MRKATAEVFENRMGTGCTEVDEETLEHGLAEEYPELESYPTSFSSSWTAMCVRG